jgi:pyrroloquinoline quinone biosynthesis protein B
MLRRLPASLGIIDGDAWALVDATNAFEEQLYRLWSRRAGNATHAEERFRPPEIVVLTHAHTGHYIGLWQLDRSVLAAREVRVLAPPLVRGFLAAQEPWRTMVDEGFIVLDELPTGVALPISSNVEIEAIGVPHRAEWPTETVGLLVRGPLRSAFYLPDIDRWDEWEHDIRAVAAEQNVVLLDGTFWDQPTSRIVPHPPMLETMDRLQRIADAGEVEIAFTHINHSNPVLRPGSAPAREVAKRGFRVAAEGQVFEL